MKRSAHNNNFCSSITRCTTVVGITMNKEIKMKPTNNTDMAVLVPKRNGSTTTAESTILRGSNTHQVESPHNERYQHSNKNNYKEEHHASSYGNADNKQKSEGQQEEHADEEDKKSDGDVAQNHDDDGCLLPPHVITSNKRRKMTMNNSQTNASSTTTTGKASRTETAPPFVISGAPPDPFRNTSNTSATNSTAGTQQEEQQINDKNNRNGNRNGSSIGNDNISISNNNKDTAAPASHDYQHYLRYLNHSIIKQSNNLSAKNNENEEYDPPGIKPHSAPTSTMGIDVINFEQEGTREDMYTKQSELKRCREKKRRQNISVAIEKLANTLTKVDPSNLIWHNNKVYFDGHTSFPSSGRERARYGGASFLKNQPLNRTEIINHTIRLVEKFALENEKGKLAVCQLQYRLSRNDSRMSSTRRGAMGDCLLSSRAISYQGLNDELMSNLLLPHHQYNHVSLFLTIHKNIFSHFCSSSFVLNRCMNFKKKHPARTDTNCRDDSLLNNSCWIIRMRVSYVCWLLTFVCNIRRY
jgi:hypothetical protein